MIFKGDSHAHNLFNPLKPGVAFLYPLTFSGGIEKKHRALMG